MGLINEKGEKIGEKKTQIKYFNTNVNNQYKYFLKSTFVNTPTSFINKKILLNLDGFDEKAPMIEDTVLWLKALRKGYKFYFLDTITVMHREYASSASKFMASLDKQKFKKGEYIIVAKTMFRLFDKVYLKDTFKFGLYRSFYHALTQVS